MVHPKPIISLVISVYFLANLALVFAAESNSGLKVSITKTWNDLPIDHNPVVIQLKPHSDNQSFRMIVKAPFFNDPARPEAPEGQSFFGLWNYEVVELFLANDADQYVEIELSPWGNYIVLLLNGTHNAIRHSLPLRYEVLDRSADEWRGQAIIPLDYLPPRVTKMNAYAIHGSDSQRTYEALYPTPTGLFPNPDFHRLAFFKPVDMSPIVPFNITELSDIWLNK